MGVPQGWGTSVDFQVWKLRLPAEVSHIPTPLPHWDSGISPQALALLSYLSGLVSLSVTCTFPH